jgi:hypothetical protein
MVTAALAVTAAVYSVAVVMAAASSEAVVGSWVVAAAVRFRPNLLLKCRPAFRKASWPAVLDGTVADW